MAKKIGIEEGMVKKEGINLKPSTPRPSEPPKGQGGFDKPYPCFEDAVRVIENFVKTMKKASIEMGKLMKKKNE